jgi:hypothetical protein
MQPDRPFWFLRSLYGWLVVLMSIITAVVVGQAWVVLLGVSGYLLALLADLVGGGSLGHTGAVRLARAEQENRELHAEQARLLGAIRELEAALAKPPEAGDAPDTDKKQASE